MDLYGGQEGPLRYKLGEQIQIAKTQEMWENIFVNLTTCAQNLENALQIMTKNVKRTHM